MIPTTINTILWHLGRGITLITPPYELEFVFFIEITIKWISIRLVNIFEDYYEW